MLEEQNDFIIPYIICEVLSSHCKTCRTLQDGAMFRNHHPRKIKRFEHSILRVEVKKNVDLPTNRLGGVLGEKHLPGSVELGLVVGTRTVRDYK